MLGLTRGSTDQTHPFIVCQNHFYDAPRTNHPMRGRMLRTDRYKYIVYDYGSKPEQLFDMENDPGEMQSLAYRPEGAEQLAAHRRLWQTWLADNDDPFVGPWANKPEAPQPAAAIAPSSSPS